MHIVIINGPNLNLLGTRSPDVYGASTLREVEDSCRAWAAENGDTIIAFQSNHEGDIIDRIHAARTADGIVINPGALTHYSYAIRDAIDAVEAPTVEVHLSNIRRREPWRRVSVVSDVCVGTIAGRGVTGYRDAMLHLSVRSSWPSVEHRYGDRDEQVGDLRLPEGGDRPHPVVVLLHGGGWRETAGRDLLGRIAVRLARRGWATWNVDFPGTGGQPTWERAPRSVDDAVAALSELAAEYPLDPSRVVVAGHGSGGHLALLAASRPGPVPVAAVLGLAPVTDPASAHRFPHLRDDVEAFLGGSPTEHPDRYSATSPIRRIPDDLPVTIVHGDRDTTVPIELSRDFAAAHRDGSVSLHEAERSTHDDLLNPESAAWHLVEEQLTSLIR